MNRGQEARCLTVILAAVVASACSMSGCSAPAGVQDANRSSVEATDTDRGFDQPALSPAVLPSVTAAAVDQTTVDTINSLRGLDFSTFLVRSYAAILMRSPRNVTVEGTEYASAVRHNLLDDLSHAYTAQTHALERGVQELLSEYDREKLVGQDRQSYDVYEWFLADLVDGQQFSEHEYAISHCRNGHHYQLVNLLTEAHPMETPEDARDYIARLGHVDEQVDQVIAAAERQREHGIVPPKFVIERTQRVIADYLGSTSREPADIDSTSLGLYTVFSRRLDDIDGLDSAERESLRRWALAEIESSFVPAYLAQLAYLDELSRAAVDEPGLWRLPSGGAYYDYLIHHHASAELTPDDAHLLGLREVARVQDELRDALLRLGYPEGVELAELVRLAVEDAGFQSLESEADREAVVVHWQEFVDEAEEVVRPEFQLWPDTPVVVVGGHRGEYYWPAPAEENVPCEFHVGLSAASQPRYMMRAVSYHEAIPGHHVQLGVARELALPQPRYDITLTAFTEGWALYAERLAYELGLFDGDPHGNVGRLLFELLRAARVVADTGIHAKGWSRDEARTYMDSVAGARTGTFDDEIDRMIVAPGASTSPELGMLLILDARDRARASLGSRFILHEFHDAVIGHGSVPLSVLDRMVDDYIANTLADDV